MDTEAIRRQTEVVDAARKAVAATQKLIAQVSARSGQDCATVSVNGVVFNLVQLNSAYMPQVVKGMEAIQRECLAILQANLSAQRSKLEGAEWKLRQLVKAA
jgi:hypothetical protein